MSHDIQILRALDAQGRVLSCILWELRRHREPLRFNYSIQVLQKKERTMPLEISLTNEQKVQITATPVTAKGKPAPIDGSISAVADNSDTLINQINPTTVEIVTPDDFSGDRTVTISADADPGTGVTTIEDTVLLHISNPQAVSLGLVASAPTVK